MYLYAHANPRLSLEALGGQSSGGDETEGRSEKVQCENVLPFVTKENNLHFDGFQKTVL